jgi:hypothetical protein
MGTPTCLQGSEMGHVSDPFLVPCRFQGLAEGLVEGPAEPLPPGATSWKLPSASGSVCPPGSP